MKICVDGYHVRNVCRRCSRFVPREVAGIVVDFRCLRKLGATAPYDTCKDFVYSAEIDKDFSYIDLCNKRMRLMRSLKRVN